MMIQCIIVLLVITTGLMVLPNSQLLPTILAQEDSLTESTAGNTTETPVGNITENTEDELQQSGTISRKGT